MPPHGGIVGAYRVVAGRCVARTVGLEGLMGFDGEETTKDATRAAHARHQLCTNTDATSGVAVAA